MFVLGLIFKGLLLDILKARGEQREGYYVYSSSYRRNNYYSCRRKLKWYFWNRADGQCAVYALATCYTVFKKERTSKFGPEPRLFLISAILVTLSNGIVLT